MSNQTNTELMERATDLADIMDQRFEDPSYFDRVETIINQSVPDLDELRALNQEMELKRWIADINDCPGITIW